MALTIYGHGDDDARALGDEAPRDARPEPRRRTGDDRALAFEPHGPIAPSLVTDVSRTDGTRRRPTRAEEDSIP